jgi:hypothetical protein
LLSRHEPLYENWDCSTEGFEGVRAQDILPLLLKHFDFDLFVPFANIVDPFIDRPFGPNFKAGRPWDIGFIDRLNARDEAEIARGAIKPTHILAAMCVGRPGTYAPLDGLTPRFCVRSPFRAPRPLRASHQDAVDNERNPTTSSDAEMSGKRDGAFELTILPTDPKCFQLLVARIGVSDLEVPRPIVECVRHEGGRIRIDLRQTTKSATEQPSTVDLELGRFPPGPLTISVHNGPEAVAMTTVIEVSDGVHAVGPSYPFVDYTDLWWNPREPGWGMSIHQHCSDRMVATWLAYDEIGKPIWYSLEPGSWMSPRMFTGPIYRFMASGNTGSFVPGQVVGENIGSGTLNFVDFSSGTFKYEISGCAGTKEIVRMQF